MKSSTEIKRIRGNAGLVKELGCPFLVTAVLVLAQSCLTQMSMALKMRR